MKKIYLQIIILLNLFLVIIWYYPTIIDFLIIHNHHYSIPNEDNKIDLIAERGTFGDMFGLLNTIFSGIALLGVVYTLYDENERIRKEKEALKEKKVLDDTNKLIFYRDIGKLIFTDISKFLVSIDDWLEENKFNKFQSTPIRYYVIHSHYELLTQRINFEEYYNCYVERYNSREILDINRSIEISYGLQNQVIILIKDFFNRYNTRKEKMLNLHKELTNITRELSLDHITAPISESLIFHNIDQYMEKIEDFQRSCSNYSNISLHNCINEMILLFNHGWEDLSKLKKDIEFSDINLRESHYSLNHSSIKISNIN